MAKRAPRLVPVICEICGETNRSALHKHHIIPRTDPKTSNDDVNLAIICASCHCKTHSGFIRIIGAFPSTQLPYKRTLVYEINGVSNVPGISEPYCIPVPVKRKINESKSKNE